MFRIRKSLFHLWKGAFPDYSMLFSVSEDAEHVQEQVDEVEVECQSAHDGHFLAGVGGAQVMGFGNSSDFLCVIGGEAHEEENADVGDDEVKEGVVQEHVHHGGDDDAQKGHEADVAHAGEIGLGEVAVDRHDAEGAGGAEEDACNGAHGVDDEDGRHGQAVQDGIDDEHRRRRAEGHAVHPGRQVPYEGDRRKEKAPHGDAASQDEGEKEGR